jgi:hypothetical protein
MTSSTKNRVITVLLRYPAGATLIILLYSAACSSTTLAFLGDHNLPWDARSGNTALNGLSGLAYCAQENRFYLISDDRSNHDPARFYTGQILFDKELSTTIDQVVFLKDAQGNFFEKNSVDLESIILLDNNNLLISSEGVKKTDSPPSLTEFKKDGQFVRTWALPKAFYWNSEKKTGVRKNLGLESLAISPDKQVVFTANEQALKQDGKKTTPKSGSPVRIVQYDRQGRVTAQYPYMVEPLPVGTAQDVKKGDNGLVDMLALDQDTLLTLERSYIPRLDRVFVKIFKIDLRAAQDVSRYFSLKKPDNEIHFLEKKLILDLDSIVPQLTEGFRSLDNIEGISFGPLLSDGTPTLLLVSDGNFYQKQRTQFIAFTIER